MNKIKEITLIGGTGASIIGKALKNFNNIKCNLIVSLVDDGGSTGKLMKDLDIPPVGDIRKALSSLSSVDNELINSFEYRFLNGELKGHTMGNIFLAGLIKQTKNLNQSIGLTKEILKVKGEVTTSTIQPVKLITLFSNGGKIVGEDNLDENKNISLGNPIEYSLKINKKANPKAVKLINKSSLTVFGPGDLGANCIAPILSKEIIKALKETKGKLVYIGNLMTKLGETHNFSVNDCKNFIEKTINRSFDYLIINDQKIPNNILKIYKKQNEYPMPFFEDKLNQKRSKLIKSRLLSDKIYKKPKSDLLRRSYLRHDGKKVAKILKKISDQ